MPSDDIPLPAPRPEGSSEGWFPDAKNPYVLFFWDGREWTSRRERTGDGWTDVPLIEERSAQDTSAPRPAYGSRKFRQGSRSTSKARTVVIVVVLALIAVVVVGVVRSGSKGGGQPPSPSKTANQLNGVGAVSKDEAWAVGSYEVRRGVTRTLVEHWHGAGWSRVQSPSAGRASVLNAVAPVSAREAWAVGSSGAMGTRSAALIVHFNGHRWTRAASPSVGAAALFGVAGTSADDVWAVGSTVDPGFGTTVALVLHFDGTSWRRVPVPVSPGPRGSALASVDAIAGANAWAVGNYVDHEGRQTPIVLHWDGASWRSLPISLASGATSLHLSSVSAAYGTNAWAVGHTGAPSGARPIVLHWDGSTWSRSHTPSLPSAAIFNSVSAVSGGDVWTVGARQDATSSVLIEHWDGRSWSIVDAPNGGAGNNELDAVDAPSGTSAFAVGAYGPTRARKLIALHWDGSSWSPT